MTHTEMKNLIFVCCGIHLFMSAQLHFLEISQLAHISCGVRNNDMTIVRGHRPGPLRVNARAHTTCVVCRPSRLASCKADSADSAERATNRGPRLMALGWRPLAKGGLRPAWMRQLAIPRTPPWAVPGIPPRSQVPCRARRIPNAALTPPARGPRPLFCGAVLNRESVYLSCCIVTLITIAASLRRAVLTGANARNDIITTVVTIVQLLGTL